MTQIRKSKKKVGPSY